MKECKCVYCVSSHFAVGAEVGGRYLQRDLVVGEFVHLLGQEVGLSHQCVCSHHLLAQPRQTLAEQLVPEKHRGTFTRALH